MKRVPSMRENGAGPANGNAIQLYSFPLKLQELRHYIGNNLFACDAKWTLFVAAANSYHYETLLKPFPPSYISKRKRLLSVINQTPNMEHVLQIIWKEDHTNREEEILDLLHYVLVKQRESRFQFVAAKEFVHLMKIMSQPNHLPCPKMVFSVGDASKMFERPPDDKPQKSADIKKTPKLAFYSGELDHFYAMLTSGFVKGQQNDCMLLNTDLALSLEMSPKCVGWGHSYFGSKIKCVAVCEFDKKEEDIPRSEGTNIYVDKSDLVRVRYLLFYNKFPFKKDEEREPKESSWLQRNKYALSLAGTLILVAIMGVLKRRARS